MAFGSLSFVVAMIVIRLVGEVVVVGEVMRLDIEVAAALVVVGRHHGTASSCRGVGLADRARARPSPRRRRFAPDLRCRDRRARQARGCGQRRLSRRPRGSGCAGGRGRSARAPVVSRASPRPAHSLPAGGRPRFRGLGATTGSKSCPSLIARASASATIEPKDGAARPASMALIIRGSRPTRSARAACVSFIRLRCRATLTPNTASFSARRSGTTRPYRGRFISNRSLSFLFLLAWAAHADDVGPPRAPDRDGSPSREGFAVG
jgi:hypothetical protein